MSIPSSSIESNDTVWWLLDRRRSWRASFRATCASQDRGWLILVRVSSAWLRAIQVLCSASSRSAGLSRTAETALRTTAWKRSWKSSNIIDEVMLRLRRCGLAALWRSWWKWGLSAPEYLARRRVTKQVILQYLCE